MTASPHPASKLEAEALYLAKLAVEGGRSKATIFHGASLTGDIRRFYSWIEGRAYKGKTARLHDGEYADIIHWANHIVGISTDAAGLWLVDEIGCMRALVNGSCRARKMSKPNFNQLRLLLGLNPYRTAHFEGIRPSTSRIGLFTVSAIAFRALPRYDIVLFFEYQYDRNGEPILYDRFGGYVELIGSSKIEIVGFPRHTETFKQTIAISDMRRGQSLTNVRETELLTGTVHGPCGDGRTFYSKMCLKRWRKGWANLKSHSDIVPHSAIGTDVIECIDGLRSLQIDGHSLGPRTIN